MVYNVTMIFTRYVTQDNTRMRGTLYMECVYIEQNSPQWLTASLEQPRNGLHHMFNCKTKCQHLPFYIP